MVDGKICVELNSIIEFLIIILFGRIGSTKLINCVHNFRYWSDEWFPFVHQREF